jgi:hypothetical protein
MSQPPAMGETPRVNPEANPLTGVRDLLRSEGLTCQPATRCLGVRRWYRSDLPGSSSAAIYVCP